MKKTLYFFLFLIITFVLIVILYRHYNKQITFETEHIIFKEKNYHINLSYPKFNDIKFDKKIKDFVEDKRKGFIKLVKDLDCKKEYDINVSFNYDIIDKIYSLHFVVSYYVGDTHYERNDYIYYYDILKRKEVFIEDLLLNKDKFYKELERLAKDYLYKNSKKLELYEEKDYLDKLEGVEDNYKYLVFGDKGFEIIFPPYVIGPCSSGEITIPISYDEVIRYLNPAYFNKNERNDNPVLDFTGDDIISDSNNNETNLEGLKNKKLVAFTFDDGPNYKLTSDFLYELDKRNAKVSFFLLGNRVINQPNLVKLIYDKGHTIGSHTYDHKNLRNLKMEEVEYQINYTNEVIENIIGVKPKYLRPPYGNYTNEILKSFDMTFILWNVDTNDWKRRNSDRIRDYIVNNVEDGDIVLLHDLYKSSIDGVLKAIDVLKEEDYAFVSIDQMIEIKGIDVELHKAYRYFK